MEKTDVKGTGKTLLEEINLDEARKGLFGVEGLTNAQIDEAVQRAQTEINSGNVIDRPGNKRYGSTRIRSYNTGIRGDYAAMIADIIPDEKSEGRYRVYPAFNLGSRRIGVYQEFSEILKRVKSEESFGEVEEIE